MQINNNNNINTNTNYKGHKMEKTMDDMAKEAAIKLYKKGRLEISEEGKFDTFYESFTDKGEKYLLYVSPSMDKDTPNERALSVAYEIEDEGNMISIVLKRGNKQEILDYLGNEKNLGEITGYAKIAYEKYLNS